MKPIVMIHPFQVEIENESEFLDAWKKVDQFMKSQPGFIETKLHKALPENALKAFSYVNVAHWENAEVFIAAVKTAEFQQVSKEVLTFSKGPGLYELMLE